MDLPRTVSAVFDIIRGGGRNRNGDKMQALRIDELWFRLYLQSDQETRTSRRRQALRMVRLVKLWTRLHIQSRQIAQARAWRQQVHLVRIDLERIGLHILPDASAREVTEYEVVAETDLSGCAGSLRS